MTIRLIPDTDELLLLVVRTDELLGWLAGVTQPDPEEGGEPFRFPAPLDGDRPIDAVAAVVGALSPALAVADDLYRTDPESALAARPRLLAPDGRYEHLPLRLVDVADDAVRVLAATMRVVSVAITPGALGRITDPAERGLHRDLGEALDQARDFVDWADTEAELLFPLARLVALLDMPADRDGGRVITALTAATGADVVFDDEEEAAYRRVGDRINLL